MSVARKSRGRSAEESEKPSRRTRARTSRDTACIRASSETTVEEPSKQIVEGETQEDDTIILNRGSSAQGTKQMYRQSSSTKVSLDDTLMNLADAKEDKDQEDDSVTEESVDSKQQDAESNATSVTAPDLDDGCSTMLLEDGGDGRIDKDVTDNHVEDEVTNNAVDKEVTDSLFGEEEAIDSPVDQEMTVDPVEKDLVDDPVDQEVALVDSGTHPQSSEKDEPASSDSQDGKMDKVTVPEALTPSVKPITRRGTVDYAGGLVMQCVEIDNTRVKKVPSTSKDEISSAVGSNGTSDDKLIKKQKLQAEKQPRILKELNSNLVQGRDIKAISACKSEDSKAKATTRSSIGGQSPSKDEIKSGKNVKGKIQLPDTLDKSLKDSIMKTINSKNKKLREKGDELVLLSDLFQHFNHYIEQLSEKEWREQLVQLSVDQNLGEKNPDKIEGILDTVQSQLLRWCAGGAVEKKETDLTKEQSRELIGIMKYEAHRNSPEDRWPRLRRMREFHKIESDFKLMNAYKALIKSIEVAITDGIIQI